MKNLSNRSYFYLFHSQIGFFALILFFISSCTSLEFNSVKGGSAANSQIKTESNSKENSSLNCQSGGKNVQWYFLFGSLPINRLRNSEIFPDANKTYRVRIQTTWLDGILSTLLGIAISVTRKTVDVEICDPLDTNFEKKSSSFKQSEPELSKAEFSKLKEEFVKQNEKQWKEEFQERFFAQKNEEIERVWKKEIKNSKNQSVIFLKTGEVVKGKLTRIDGGGFKLFYNGKERVFTRAEVLKVRFQD
ncbi:hypothetical protein AB3N59_04415 [Leptospira sp. WS92.C1]